MLRVEFRSSRLTNFPGRLRRIPQVLQGQVANALNVTGDRLVNRLANDLAMESNLPLETVRGQIKIQRASYQRLEYSIDASAVKPSNVTSSGRRLPERRFGTPREGERFFNQGEKVKIVTMQDEAVCKQCQAAAEGTYAVEEARSMIPIHPNCRCHIEPLSPIQDNPNPTFTTPSGKQPQRGGGVKAEMSLAELVREMKEGVLKATLTVRDG